MVISNVLMVGLMVEEMQQCAGISSLCSEFKSMFLLKLATHEVKDSISIRKRCLRNNCVIHSTSVQRSSNPGLLLRLCSNTPHHYYVNSKQRKQVIKQWARI